MNKVRAIHNILKQTISICNRNNEMLRRLSLDPRMCEMSQTKIRTNIEWNNKIIGRITQASKEFDEYAKNIVNSVDNIYKRTNETYNVIQERHTNLKKELSDVK